MQPHIQARDGDVEQIVLFPGDPGRIKVINSLCKKTTKISHNREFCLYRSIYKDVRVSILSTGIGCPSAAIALEEAMRCGGKVFIRVGTCGALRKKIRIGDIIIPYAAIRMEGTTAEYTGTNYPAVANPGVYNTLISSARDQGARFFSGINRTHDGFYESKDNFNKLREVFANYPQNDLVSSEMECSAVFLLAQLYGLQAGGILAVNTEEPLDIKRETRSEEI